MGLISRDVDGGSVVNVYYDAHTDETHVERWQDVEPLLDGLKGIRARRWDGFTADRSMQALAEIPVALLEHWQQVDGFEWWRPDNEAELLKRLDDPLLRAFRYDTKTAHAGRIIVKGLK